MVEDRHLRHRRLREVRTNPVLRTTRGVRETPNNETVDADLILSSSASGRGTGKDRST